MMKKLRLLVVPAHLIILCKLSQSSQPSQLYVDCYACSNFDQISSPLGAPTMSRSRKAGMTRTQSGSYILNLSKQPTPAPSPSERDGDYEPAGDYGIENMDVDNNGGALPVSHSYILSFP